MGRTVILEEKVEEYISSLYGRHNWQSGLVIGQLTPQRDYIVQLAQTPEQSEEIQSESPSSSKAVERWKVEHARQVSRMLTGNFEVIGVYCFGSPETINKELPKLRHLLFAIHKAITNKLSAFLEGNPFECDRLLLQICSKTKKITCKSLDVSDQQSTARPAEFKYQSFLSKWNRVEAELSLRISACVPDRLSRAALKTRIMHSLNPTLNRIAGALASVNGDILPSEQPLVIGHQGKGGHTKSAATQTFTVEFFTENSPTASTEEREISGKVHIWGTTCCRACVNPKATVGDAVQALKYDAIRSVVSRCDVLCDDIMAADEESDCPGKQEEEEKKCVRLSRWLAPQRVLTRISGTPVDFCDYAFADEKAQDSVERMNELLGIFASTDALEYPERFPDCEQITNIVSEVCKNDGGTSEEESNLKPNESFGNRILGVVIALVTAMTAAGVTYLWGEQG